VSTEHSVLYIVRSAEPTIDGRAYVALNTGLLKQCVEIESDSMKPE